MMRRSVVVAAAAVVVGAAWGRWRYKPQPAQPPKLAPAPPNPAPSRRRWSKIGWYPYDYVIDRDALAPPKPIRAEDVTWPDDFVDYHYRMGSDGMVRRSRLPFLPHEAADYPDRED